MREKGLHMHEDGKRLKRGFFEKIPNFFFSVPLFTNLLIFSDLLF